MNQTNEGIDNFQMQNTMQFLADLEPFTLEERERLDTTPVGLKNIGNTCYINCFIQALYHLPVVMKTIMSLKETTDLQRQSSLNAMKRIESSYKLILEMKRLFAFMTKTSKKYTNPTYVIKNIVDDFGNQLKIGSFDDFNFNLTILYNYRRSAGYLRGERRIYVESARRSQRYPPTIRRQ